MFYNMVYLIMLLHREYLHMVNFPMLLHREYVTMLYHMLYPMIYPSMLLHTDYVPSSNVIKSSIHCHVPMFELDHLIIIWFFNPDFACCQGDKNRFSRRIVFF